MTEIHQNSFPFLKSFLSDYKVCIHRDSNAQSQRSLTMAKSLKSYSVLISSCPLPHLSMAWLAFCPSLVENGPKFSGVVVIDEFINLFWRGVSLIFYYIYLCCVYEYLRACVCMRKYMHACVWCVHACMRVCRWENNLRKLVLAFNHVCAAARTQVGKLDSKCLYPPSHLAGPKFPF